MRIQICENKGAGICRDWKIYRKTLQMFCSWTITFCREQCLYVNFSLQ